MTSRPLSVVPLTVTVFATLAVSPATTPTLPVGTKTVLAEAKLLDTESWVIGGSGNPIPSADGITATSERYVDPSAYPDFSNGQPLFPGQPQFPVDATNALFTPEGLYPITGVKSLEFDPSVAQGITILNDTINKQIAEGNNLVVVGSSQSAVIAGREMQNLLALPKDEQPTADQLSFVLRGDEGNPDGGLLERFGDSSLPPLSAPSLGITFTGQLTPADTPWDTAIYTAEYDGFADFPRYPIDLLSDLNALLGFAFVHTAYSDFTPEQLAKTIELPVTDDYTGHTQYFMIPMENLPLLDPIRLIPMVGNPLADLLQPDLKVLVNLGYGSITDGWDQGPANVPTPFGLFPTDINPADVLTALANGAQQGVQDFFHDLESPSTQGVSDMTTDTADTTTNSLPSFTDIVNTFSGDVATLYAALLPVADIVNALSTTLPAYEASLFAQELSSGDLLDAIGLPIAAAFGLDPLAVGFAADPVLDAITHVLGLPSLLETF
jgi:hypothetical protein